MNSENLEKIRILKAARERIECGRNSCICYAINDVNVGRQKLRSQIQSAIMMALGRHPFYEHWVRAHHPDKCDVDATTRIRLARAGRLAWIDDMIKNLKAA